MQVCRASATHTSPARGVKPVCTMFGQTTADFSVNIDIRRELVQLWVYIYMSLHVLAHLQHGE